MVLAPVTSQAFLCEQGLQSAPIRIVDVESAQKVTQKLSPGTRVLSGPFHGQIRQVDDSVVSVMTFTALTPDGTAFLMHFPKTQPLVMEGAPVFQTDNLVVTPESADYGDEDIFVELARAAAVGFSPNFQVERMHIIQPSGRIIRERNRKHSTRYFLAIDLESMTHLSVGVMAHLHHSQVQSLFATTLMEVETPLVPVVQPLRVVTAKEGRRDHVYERKLNLSEFLALLENPKGPKEVVPPASRTTSTQVDRATVKLIQRARQRPTAQEPSDLVDDVDEISGP